jgi:hypothetical protein
MEIKTINLKGKSYAPVSERLKALHEEMPSSDIETSYEFKEGWCIFKATVRPDVEKTPDISFSGHSLGKMDKEKALEKLETVAVGRALAFMGFAPDGSIASYEEMEKFNESNE